MSGPNVVLRTLGLALAALATPLLAHAGVPGLRFNVNPDTGPECWTFEADGTLCVADLTTLGTDGVTWSTVELNPFTDFFTLHDGDLEIGSGVITYDSIIQGNAGPNTAFFIGFLTERCPCSGCDGMLVESCSLGCGIAEGQASCAGGTIFANQEVVLDFSQELDLATINSSSVAIVSQASGMIASGSFLTDPSDASVLIFRPSLNVDASGNLVTGFVDGETYSVRVAGDCAGAASVVASLSGEPNQLPLECSVQVTGLQDAAPGAPSVGVFVDIQLFDAGGNPTNIVPDVPADGAIDVAQDSDITLVFDDLMNPGALIDPMTGASPSIEVLIDEDGDLATQGDQSPLAGSFAFAFDPASSTTTLIFDPECIPGSGVLGRRVLVRFLPGITDLVGNRLANPMTVAFAGEGNAGATVDLVEDFTGTARRDDARSGAEMWTGSGRLVPGYGGGSGRLGELKVRAGQIVVLDTDDTSFGAIGENDVLTNLTPGIDYDPLNRATWPTIDVTDGVFDFSTIEIDAGGTLLLRGDAPGVLLSRGNAGIDGDVDAAGETGPMHLGLIPRTFMTVGGPNGAHGGEGGTRYDASAFFSGGAVQGPARPINLSCSPMDTQCPPGTVVPSVGDNCCLDLAEAMDGQPGGEVGQGVLPPFGSDPSGSNGNGGIHWPRAFPISPSGGGLQDLIVDDSGPGADCRSKQVGGPGAGGGYVFGGADGIPVTLPNADGTFNPLNLPPNDTPGGGAISIEAPNPQNMHFVRRLSPTRGFLRGGSGGGGGGTHLFNTGNKDPFDIFPCSQQGNIWEFYDNSGAPGGAGGGGLSLTSGATLALNGRVIAAGGDGGSAGALPPSRTGGADHRNVTPGGGGSGGSVRMQAYDMQIAASSGRVDVSGGSGGIGVAGSTGGDGSRGLVRLEQPPRVQRNPLTRINRASERGKVAPFDAQNPTDSNEHLSVGRWARPRGRPDSISGATSCWLQVADAGCQRRLVFEADDLGQPGDPSDDTFGWNLDLVYDDGTGEQVFPYRGVPNDPSFPLLDSFEATLGNQLGSGLPTGQGSFLVVRFQGARSLDPQLADPCAVELGGDGSEIVLGSLTPWVAHPADLNGFAPAPNMVRFCVLFDTSVAFPGSVSDAVQAVAQLSLRVTPE